MKLKPDQRQPLQESIAWFKSNYLVEHYRLVNERLGIVSPVADLHRVYSETDKLFELFQSWPTAQLLEFDDSLAPCLKRALISFRLSHARFLDSFRTHTTNPEIIKQLEDKLAPLDSLLDDPDFAAVQPLPMPKLVDLVTVQTMGQGEKEFWSLQNMELFIIFPLRELSHVHKKT